MNELNLRGFSYQPEGVKVFVEHMADGTISRVEIQQDVPAAKAGTVLDLAALLDLVLADGSAAHIVLKQNLQLSGIGTFNGIRISSLHKGRAIGLDIEQNVPRVEKDQEFRSLCISSNRARGFGPISLGGMIGPGDGKVIQQYYETFVVYVA